MSVYLKPYLPKNHFPNPSSSFTSWRVLEAELSDRSALLLAGLRLRLIVVLQPADAPRAFRKAGIGGVVLAPFDHELLEVTAAPHPHPSRSELQLAGVRAKARELLQGDAAAGKCCRQMASALYGNSVRLHLLVGLSGHAPADEGCRGRWRSVRANWFVEHLGKIGGQRGMQRGRRDRWRGGRHSGRAEWWRRGRGSAPRRRSRYIRGGRGAIGVRGGGDARGGGVGSFGLPMALPLVRRCCPWNANGRSRMPRARMPRTGDALRRCHCLLV
eukprot:scaffold14044_cov52-Phaeocystis_antarctica.AAC.3